MKTIGKYILCSVFQLPFPLPAHAIKDLHMDYRPYRAFSPPDTYSPSSSDQQDDIVTLKRRIIDLELNHESERFRLIHDFTVRLREEERRRAELLSKVAELEGVQMRLERELFESRGPGVDERARGGFEGWNEAERLQQQLRTAGNQLDAKREELGKVEHQVTALQHETIFLKEEMKKCESDLSNLRKENTTLRLENQRLNQENDRLTAKLQEFVGISKEVPTGDYASLQHRLETTTLKIKSLEELIMKQEKPSGVKGAADQTRRRSLSRGKPTVKRTHSRDASARRIDLKAKRTTARK